MSLRPNDVRKSFLFRYSSSLGGGEQGGGSSARGFVSTLLLLCLFAFVWGGGHTACGPPSEGTPDALQGDGVVGKDASSEGFRESLSGDSGQRKDDARAQDAAPEIRSDLFCEDCSLKDREGSFVERRESRRDVGDRAPDTSVQDSLGELQVSDNIVRDVVPEPVWKDVVRESLSDTSQERECCSRDVSADRVGSDAKPPQPASGFAASARRWTLPLSGTSRGFYAVGAASSGQYWSLFDLDGDGKPDLVQTADPATQKIWGGSRGYWKRFANTGSGFAQASSRWSVPSSGTGKGFYLTGSASQGGFWTVVDLDGDKKPDLVQTADPATQKVWGGSRGYWQVYKNTGSGFATTAQRWSVPSSGTGKGFYIVGAASSGQYWSLFDLDGDGKPDLVQTADPTTQKIWGGSRGYWQVYKNTGSGFSRVSSRWFVPSSGTGKGFYLTGSASQGGFWTVVDLDGDKKPDLVQTADPVTQKVWGGSRGYWKRFANTGSGFAQVSSRWSVPLSGTSRGFYIVGAASSGQYWSLFDLDGDGKPDLVQTADPATQKIWGGSRGYWKRFVNTGSGFAASATQWSVPVSRTSKGFYLPASGGSREVWSIVDLDGDKRPELVQTTDPNTQKIWGGSRGYWLRYLPQ